MAGGDGQKEVLRGGIQSHSSLQRVADWGAFGDMALVIDVRALTSAMGRRVEEEDSDTCYMDITATSWCRSHWVTTLKSSKKDQGVLQDAAGAKETWDIITTETPTYARRLERPWTKLEYAYRVYSTQWVINKWHPWTPRSWNFQSRQASAKSSFSWSDWE